MTDNILNVYRTATPAEVVKGMFWYSDANAFASNLDPDSPVSAAAVIAALSPRLRWDKNLAYAVLAYNLKGYDITPDILSYIPTLNNSRKKALAIVNGGDPFAILGKGPKTNAFFDNIANPFTSEKVTVDKHAFDIAMGERTGYSTVITNKSYVMIANAYRDAAFDLGVLPHQLQAITWESWRNGNRG